MFLEKYIIMISEDHVTSCDAENSEINQILFYIHTENSYFKL